MYQVLKYLNEHLDSKLTQKEVADLFGYSVAYFCEKFKIYTGLTFCKYMNRRRMQYAAKSLMEGKTITDIAFELGYNSINGFKKAFKNEFGVEPTQYKKQERAVANNHISYLPERCRRLKNNINDTNSYHKYAGQHMYYFMKGYYAVPEAERTYMRLVSSSLCSVIDNFQPIIEKDELIVGYNYDNPEMEINVFFNQTLPNVEYLKKYLNSGSLLPAQIDELIDKIMQKQNPWKPNYMYYDILPEFVKIDKISDNDMKIIRDFAATGMCKINNHCIPDYKTVLERGFKGILENVKSLYKEENSSFYDCLINICRSAMKIGKKYAAEAMRMAAQTEDECEKERLYKIAQVCLKVPENPATSFYEAVQSIYFTHIMNTWEDGINANSLGRLDQLLYPYYIHDVSSGIITADEAYELICGLWIKLYQPHNVQQCTIGGCDSKGHDAVNALSYMILDCIESVGLGNSLSVRYSHITDRRFLYRAFKALKTLKNGQPSFYNDDCLIPALVRQGIKWEDAADYALLGCVEPTLPGKSNSHSSTAYCNLVKAVEYTLGRGKSIYNKNQDGDGIDTGNPCGFKTFAKFFDAVCVHLNRIIEAACNIVNECILEVAKKASLPYKTLLTQGCIETGKDYAAGGALYNYYQIMVAGFANLVDSLEAVRTIIYQEKRFTMAQLIEFIENDFPDENIRQVFMNKAPKYGNNIAKTDEMAGELYKKICSYIEKQKPVLGEAFHPQFFSDADVDNIMFGKNTAATPDGRHRGDLLSYGATPMNGCDINGYEAVLNSTVSLPTVMAAGVTSLIVNLEPYVFTDGNFNRILDMFIKASEHGLCSTIFNIISQEDLNNAMLFPHKYSHILINTSGYSRPFVSFPKDLQLSIINKTKHKSM